MDKRSWCLALAVWLLVGTAQAQVTASEKASAEALFDRGLELMREGKLAEACARLEQSQAIEHGIGTMLYLADCYEKSGRTASAWALFREAASEAQAGGQSERAIAGRQRAERLEPVLSRLTIDVPEAQRVPGLEVLRNGAVLPQGLWGLALPVDPGVHRVEARAPGHNLYAQNVTVEKGPGSWKLEIPPLTPAPVAQSTGVPVDATTAAAPAVASSPSQPTASATTEQSADRKHKSWLKPLGLSAIIAGGALVALGGGLGIRAIRKNSQAKDKGCDGKFCEDQAGVELTDDARSAATISTVGWAVGGTFLAAGLLTYFLAPDEETRVSLSIDAQRASLSFGGAF
jgi:hypothetical protein